MNNNYKYLVWAGTGVLVVLGIFLVVMTGHIANTATNTNTVSFDGEGRIFAKPDIAVISFSIVTEAATSTAAQDSNSQKSQKVVEFVKSQGIEDKDIKTTGYNVYPQYNVVRPCPISYDYRGTMMPDSISYPCDNTQKITGYQVNQSFELKVRDLQKVSTMLDGLVTAGANQVNNLGLQIDDIEKVKIQARELAIKNAKEKAKTLRRQLGLRLGKLVNYYEGGGYPMYLKAEAAFDGRGGIGGGGPAPAMPVGENEVIVNVTLTYQIR